MFDMWSLAAKILRAERWAGVPAHALLNAEPDGELLTKEAPADNGQRAGAEGQDVSARFSSAAASIASMSGSERPK